MNGDNLKKIKIIVIGLGKIGLHYAFDDKRKQPASHIAAIMNNPNLKLVGVCDPDKKSLEKLGLNFNNKKLDAIVNLIDRTVTQSTSKVA